MKTIKITKQRRKGYFALMPNTINELDLREGKKVLISQESNFIKVIIPLTIIDTNFVKIDLGK